MTLLVVGVSHKSASVDVLSQLAMDAAASLKLVDQLLTSEHIDEAVILSTCNRTEIYTSVARFHGAVDDITDALAEFAGLAAPDLRRSCSVYFDEGAVAHTFAVASGLDSLVLGENQILGQVRAALTLCQTHGTVGTVLNSLFQQALGSASGCRPRPGSVRRAAPWSVRRTPCSPPSADHSTGGGCSSWGPG